MAPLPPREQRHPFLRYQGLEYTDANIADFRERLERIYSREIHRVQVVDFLGMPELIRDGLFARMVMEHRDDAARLDLVREEMESPDFARYWSESKRMILGKGDLHDYWRDILTAGDFLGPPPFYTLIRDSVLRLCHGMMAHIFARRSQAPKKVTVKDLFYLIGMNVGSINVPYLLARYLRLFAAGRKNGAHISSGHFVARLARHFGLLTAEILGGLIVISLELPIIDMERQPDAAASTLAVVEDAPAADEGDQAIPAPVQAPQQPPSPPLVVAMTMPQRLGRLEEELMDASGLTYQAFDGTFQGSSPAAFQRHTRQRPGEASTSTAQQDPQQPDP
ncbi:hypothetical protein Tco_1007933 [Tanacetum coccineum]